MVGSLPSSFKPVTKSWYKSGRVEWRAHCPLSFELCADWSSSFLTKLLHSFFFFCLFFVSAKV